MKKKTSNEKRQKKKVHARLKGKVQWNRKKVFVTGGICIVLAAFGGTMWHLTSQSADSGQNQNAMQDGEMPGEGRQGGFGEQNADSSNMVTASGYATYGMITQTMDLSGLRQSALLEVSDVLVASGDSVAKGDALLTVTQESYDNVKSLLEDAYKEAQNDVSDAQLEYTEGKLEAQYDYLSNSNLASISLAEYNSEVSNLKKTVSEAKESYETAKKAVNNNPAKIKKYKNKIAKAQKQIKEYNTQIASYEKTIEDGTNDFETKKASYLAALKNYQQLLNTYQYLLTANGEDASSISSKLTTIETELDTVKDAEITVKEAATSENAATDKNSSNSDASKQAADSSNNSANASEAMSNLPADAQNGMPTGDAGSTMKAQSMTSQSLQETTEAVQSQDTAQVQNAVNVQEMTISQLLAKLKTECDNLSSQCETAKGAYNVIYQKMQNASEQLSTYQEKKQEKSSKVTEWKQTKKTLKSEYTDAKNSVDGLQASYVTALNNQVTKLVALKEEYEQDVITSEGAETTYKEALQSLEDALQEKKDTAEEWKEKLSAFKNAFSNYQLLSEYEGTITAINYASGDVIMQSAMIAAYKDTDTVTTTVSVSQEDISKLSVGDSAMIISSSGGQYSGTVQSIASATASESISDVSYEVVVVIETEEDSEIATSDTLSIYFNANFGRQMRN